MTRRAPLRPAPRGDRGVVAVETALVVPLLLALLGGVLLFGFHMWASAVTDHAAQAGVRTAVVRETVGRYADDAPYASGWSGYRNLTAVRGAVARALSRTDVPACTAGSRPTLPPGATACTWLTGTPGVAAVGGGVRRKTQGDVVSVTVVQRVPAVQAAAGFIPFAGPRLAARLGVVRSTVQGRLE